MEDAWMQLMWYFNLWDQTSHSTAQHTAHADSFLRA